MCGYMNNHGFTIVGAVVADIDDSQFYRINLNLCRRAAVGWLPEWAVQRSLKKAPLKELCCGHAVCCGRHLICI